MNLRLLRKRAGLSQAALTEAMTERGHPWHQQTVGRIEAGQQPARVAEMEDLAIILHTSMDRFMWGSAEANEAEFVFMAGTRVRRQYEAVAEAVHAHLSAIAMAERILERPPQSDSSLVKEARDDTAARIEEYSAEAAVDEGVRRYEEQDGGDEEDGEEADDDGDAQSEP